MTTYTYHAKRVVLYTAICFVYLRVMVYVGVFEYAPPLVDATVAAVAGPMGHGATFLLFNVWGES